jgi:hypothetical protein
LLNRRRGGGMVSDGRLGLRHAEQKVGIGRPTLGCRDKNFGGLVRPFEIHQRQAFEHQRVLRFFAGRIRIVQVV